MVDNTWNVHLLKALFKVLDSVAPLVVVEDSTTYTDKQLLCHIGDQLKLLARKAWST